MLREPSRSVAGWTVQGPTVHSSTLIWNQIWFCLEMHYHIFKGVMMMQINLLSLYSLYAIVHFLQTLKRSIQSEYWCVCASNLLCIVWGAVSIVAAQTEILRRKHAERCELFHSALRHDFFCKQTCYSIRSRGFLLFLQQADGWSRSITLLSMIVCPAESAQAAGGSHPGWGNLGNAAQRHRVWTRRQQGTSSTASHWNSP